MRVRPVCAGLKIEAFGATICESELLAIFESDTNLSVHLFHASIINEVCTIIIVYTNGLVFVCIWIDNFFGVVADVSNSLGASRPGISTFLLMASFDHR